MVFTALVKLPQRMFGTAKRATSNSHLRDEARLRRKSAGAVSSVAVTDVSQDVFRQEKQSFQRRRRRRLSCVLPAIPRPRWRILGEDIILGEDDETSNKALTAQVFTSKELWKSCGASSHTETTRKCLGTVRDLTDI